MAHNEDRQHQLIRLLQILDRMERGDKVTRKLMATECGCSMRTIARDLTFLKGMGVEITFDASAATYKLDSSLPFKTVQFSLAEVVALAIARESLQARSGSPFQPTINTAFARIISHLPADLQSTIAATRDLISFDAALQRDYAQAPWQQLTQAAQSQHTVEICYHTLSRNQWSFRRVDPYLLAERGRYMMLVAYCHNRREVREFALDRIRQLHSTGDSFTISPSFCRDEYFRGSINALRGAQTNIVVRFDPHLAPYAHRRQWPFPHQFEQLEDGGLLLRGTVSGEKGIRNELLSWGSGVEVLEPATLRAAMCAEAQAICDKYRPKNS